MIFRRTVNCVVVLALIVVLIFSFGQVASADTTLRVVMHSDLKIVDPIWTTAYMTGLFPWTGREGGTLKSFGAGRITIVGNQDRTSSIGFKTFYYWSGQEVVLRYDADVRKGGLRIYLAEGGGLRQRVYDTVTVDETGSGEISYRIPRSGFYTWSISPTVTAGGRGYDLGYTAVWGARPAG